MTSAIVLLVSILCGGIASADSGPGNYVTEYSIYGGGGYRVESTYLVKPDGSRQQVQVLVFDNHTGHLNEAYIPGTNGKIGPNQNGDALSTQERNRIIQAPSRIDIGDNRQDGLFPRASGATGLSQANRYVTLYSVYGGGGYRVEATFQLLANGGRKKVQVLVFDNHSGHLNEAYIPKANGDLGPNQNGDALSAQDRSRIIQAADRVNAGDNNEDTLYSNEADVIPRIDAILAAHGGAPRNGADQKEVLDPDAKSVAAPPTAVRGRKGPSGSPVRSLR